MGSPYSFAEINNFHAELFITTHFYQSFPLGYLRYNLLQLVNER